MENLACKGLIEIIKKFRRKRLHVDCGMSVDDQAELGAKAYATTGISAAYLLIQYISYRWFIDTRYIYISIKYHWKYEDKKNDDLDYF